MSQQLSQTEIWIHIHFHVIGYFDTAFKLISFHDPGHSDFVPMSATGHLAIYSQGTWIGLTCDQVFILYYTRGFI